MALGNHKLASAGLERPEHCFWRDIWKAAPLDAVREAGVEMRWFGPLLATAFARLPEAPLLNVIRGAGEPGATRDGYLDEAVEWMQDWGVDFLLPVASARPGAAEAEAWLNWHGYEQRNVSRKYVRRVAGPRLEDVPEVEVVKLEPLETEGMSWLAAQGLGLPDFSSFLFCDLPELPGWHCYSGWVDGREVACGSMLIVDQVAVLGLDATAPEARGRGCHRALVRRRLADAEAAGCHTAVASAFDLPGGESATGLSLRRAGFVQAYRSVGWQQPLQSRPIDSYAWLN